MNYRSEFTLRILSFLATALAFTGSGCSTVRGTDPVLTSVKIALKSGVALSSLAKGSCPKVRLTLLDQNATPFVAAAATSFTVSGLGSATLFSDTTCGTQAASNQLTVPSGASSVDFSLLDLQAETLSLSAAGAGLTGAVPSLVIKGFSTTDQFNHGGAVEIYASIGKDSQGSLYACGATQSGSGGFDFIVRKSSDSGATWSTVLTYRYNSSDAACNSVQGDGLGNVFASGAGIDGGGVAHWITLKSTDYGANWALSDETLNTGTDVDDEGMSIAFNSQGVVFVSGFVTDAAFQIHAFLRKSTDHGATWSTADYYQRFPGHSTNSFETVAVGSDDSIYYAVGALATDDTTSSWVVRKSSDGGTTWTTVDTYQFGGTGVTNTPKVIIADTTSGKLYVSGSVSESGHSHSVLRASSDGGTTWTILDDFTNDSAYETYSGGFVVDTATGTLFQAYQAGYAVGGKFRSIVRRSLDGGTTWAEIDNFVVEANACSGFNAMITTSDGGIVGVGQAIDIGGQTYALARTL